MPLVSVIIPSYQGADVLHKAFDSVQQQTFTDLEVIVVDDGSTDNTQAVVEAASAADPRIRYLRQANQGPAAARNTGIDAAVGDYLALLDADDTWEPEKLAGQVAILDQFPEIGAVFTDSIDINTVDGTQFTFSEHYARTLDGVPREPLDGIADGYRLVGDFRTTIFGGNFIHTSSMMMRKTVFEQAGRFNPDCFGTEDIDLWLRLIRITTFGYWRQVCTTRVKSETSISQLSERRLQAVKHLYDMYLGSAQDADLHPRIKTKMPGLYRRLVRVYGRSGQPGKAIGAFRASLAYGFDYRTAMYAAASVLGPLPFRVGRWIARRIKR
jgi:glycosyltransferase involved in cell wall biosynthesis